MVVSRKTHIFAPFDHRQLPMRKSPHSTYDKRMAAGTAFDFKEIYLQKKKENKTGERNKKIGFSSVNSTLAGWLRFLAPAVALIEHFSLALGN